MRLRIERKTIVRIIPTHTRPAAAESVPERPRVKMRTPMRVRVASLLAEGAQSRDLRNILDRAAKDYLSGNHDALDVFASVIDTADAAARRAVLSALGHSTDPETTVWSLEQIMDRRVLS